ncbi:MAG TPA: nitrite reductase small subunit NirD [Chondromyces sp.]|nr:nitrite reductase small subunit NirD [Chondromyces sp.]
MEGVKVARYNELPKHAGYTIEMKDKSIALFRLTNGEIRAVANHSPHPKGGVLSEGIVNEEFVYCPVYDWKISLIDELMYPPDNGQVKTYKVEVENEDVYIVID